MAEMKQDFDSALPELHNLAEKSLKLGLELGASQLEVIITNGFKKSLELKNSSINGLQQQSNNRFKVRAYVGKRLGIGSTTSLALSSVENAINDAVTLAKLTPEDPQFHSLAEPMDRKVADVKRLFDRELATYDPEQFIEFANDLTAGVSEVNELAKANGGLNVITTERVIANSLGINVGIQSTNFQGYIGANIVLDPTNVGLAYEMAASRTLKDLKSGFETGQEAGRKAKDMLDAKGAPTGTFDVLVDGRAAFQSFQSLVGGGVNGFSVMTKTSYFADKMGEDVAVPTLQVWDDPHVDGALGGRAIDAEGIPTTRIGLIENGVLTSYVTDTYTSRILGVENTGSASGMGKIPRPGVSNIQVAEGEDSRDAMLEDMKEGIYLESPIGGMFNRGSVNISNKIDRGFYVKDGEIQYPLKNSMLGTNVFEFFKGITAVSKEMFKDFGVQSPSIVVRDISIGGAGEQKQAGPRTSMSSY